MLFGISKTKIDISVPQKTPKRTALALALISVDDQLKDFYAKKDANFVDANTTCYKSVNDLCNDVLVVYKSHLAATMRDFNTAEEDTFRFRRLSAYVDQFRVKKTFPESMNGTKFLTKKDICEFCKRTGKLLTKYENRDENYLMRTI